MSRLEFDIDTPVAEEIEFFAAMSGQSTQTFLHDLVNMGLNQIAQLPEYQVKAQDHLRKQEATAERVINRCVRQNHYRDQQRGERQHRGQRDRHAGAHHPSEP